jgi:tetratricopeptide (TPR) repeat protein
MNRIVLTGLVALVAGFPGLMAQQQPAAPPAQQQQAAPAQPKPAAGPKQPMPKSQGELEALKAMFGATTPDDRIKAADALLAKYADTDFKDMANYFTADAYRMKSDGEKQIFFLERTLEVNPKHFQAMVDLAEAIAQRTKEFDLNREESLAKVDKYAKAAIEILKDAPKPNPQLPDEQWNNVKKDMTARAHQAMGMAAMTRKDNAKAIAEFKTAVEGASTPEPAFQVRLAQAYMLDGKWDDAVTISEKVMNNPQAHPQVKQVAQAIRASASEAKAKGLKPAQSNQPGGAIKVEVK